MNNFDPNLIKNAKSKDPKKLLDSLSAQDKEKVNNILSNKEALADILKSPQAQAILKMLSGKGNNG